MYFMHGQCWFSHDVTKTIDPTDCSIRMSSSMEFQKTKILVKIHWRLSDFYIHHRKQDRSLLPEMIWRIERRPREAGPCCTQHSIRFQNGGFLAIRKPFLSLFALIFDFVVCNGIPARIKFPKRMEGSELRQIRVVNNDISFGKTQQDEETVHKTN